MAGKQRTFDQDTKRKIESILDGLPEKPKSERALTTKELVGEMRAKIRAAQAKGYTLEEIVEMFKQGGAQLSLSSIKSALKGSSSRRAKAQPPQPQEASNSPGETNT